MSFDYPTPAQRWAVYLRYALCTPANWRFNPADLVEDAGFLVDHWD
jgi:hypothetical protein